MIIQKLEKKHLNEAYLLLNELYDNTIIKQVFTEKYVHCLKDSDFYGIVAIQGEKVVGILISRIINRLVKNKDILFIDDLIVHKDFRNKGIGRKLLEEAIRFGKNRNFETIELTSYMPNINSHRLYENMDFKKQHYKFKYYLDKKTTK